MGKKTNRISWWVVLVLVLASLLVVGCNRSLTEPEEAEVGEETTTEESTTEQTMATPDSPVEPEATAAVEEETEEVQPTEEAAEPPPEPTEAPPAMKPTAEPPPTEERAYVILPGDTLYSIAQAYGVTVEAIAARNGIINVHQIEVGQQIIIPAAGEPPTESEEVPGTGEQVHVVQAGENLFRISLAYNMSFESVAAYNAIPWPYHIYPGQEIRIPPSQ
jgi:LysM repeat protein